MVIDGVVTTVYRNSVLDKVLSVPGYASKLVNDRKFKKDADCPQPVAVATGGRHTFVPFAMEDGGGLGAHAHATLKLLAKYAVGKGRLPPRARHVAPPLPPATVALWIRRWHHRLSAWLHLTLSRQVLRYVPITLHCCGGVLLLDCQYGSIRNRVFDNRSSHLY